MVSPAAPARILRMLARPLFAFAPLLFGSFLLGGCGSCPPSRYRGAEPARDETVSFDWSAVRRDNGCVRISGATYCYSEVDLQSVSAPTTACAAACDRLTRSEGVVTSCSYRADRTGVQCILRIPEKAETCSCSLLDC